jgi:hypothetical protein
MIGCLGMIARAMVALTAATPQPVTAVMAEARGAPVEIFADVVFRLIDAHRVAPKDRAALLDEVFQRAGEAREPMAVRMAALFPPLPIRDRMNIAIRHADPGLDALSIRCRAVKALLATDRKRARDRFAEIAPLDVPKPDCRSVTAAEPAVYYDTLAALYRDGQIPFSTIENAVREAHTSLEIVAAARDFPQLARNQKEGLALTGTFAAALEIADSDRNFGLAVQRNGLVSEILSAGALRFSSLGVSPQALQAALRAYLVRHLTAVRCEDNGAAYFPTTLRGFGVSEISDEESTPARLEGRADLPRHGDEDDYNELRNDVDALDKDEPDANRIGRVLDKLGKWNGCAGEDGVEVFHRKVSLYSSLMTRFPGDARPRILSGLISTLEDSAGLDVSPAAWLNDVKEVSRSGHPDIAQAMADSRLPALQAYGQMVLLLQAR